MLEDMVPIMDVIINDNMFDKYHSAIEYALRTWD